MSGRFPSDAPGETFELASLRLPQDLPVSLPSTLVARRLDVRAAEAQLHAASAQIGVALAAGLPQFAITATAGGASTVFTRMFASGNPATVAQTLFDGGTRLHQQRAAEAAYEQSAAQYRTTVIGAFQSVADALHALVADAETLKAAVAIEQATRTTLDITTEAQRLGAANYLAVLSAQQAYCQALLARVPAQAARLSDTVVVAGAGRWLLARSGAVGASSVKAADDHHCLASLRNQTMVASRILLMITVGCVLMACARDAVMLNPRTGETMTCRASSLNPWSQQEACVGDHIAQGWRRLD